MQFLASCLLFLLAAAPSAFAKPAPKGASYTTVTITSVSSTVVSVATDISTVIKKAGTKTIIPDTLTIVFNAVPATLSLHTTLESTSYTTVYSTSKVLISSSAPTSTSSTSPPPSAPTTGTYTCGQQGVANTDMSTYDDGYVFWVPEVHPDYTPGNCRSTCQEITQCQSYSYNPTTLDCTLYASPIDITPSTTSGAYFLGKYNTVDLSNCWSG